MKKLALWLLIIGGLNWLIIGIFNVDVVAKLGMTIARIIYVLVGLSAIVQIFSFGKRSQSSGM